MKCYLLLGFWDQERFLHLAWQSGAWDCLQDESQASRWAHGLAMSRSADAFALLSYEGPGDPLRLQELCFLRTMASDLVTFIDRMKPGWIAESSRKLHTASMGKPAGAWYASAEDEASAENAKQLAAKNAYEAGGRLSP